MYFIRSEKEVLKRIHGGFRRTTVPHLTKDGWIKLISYHQSRPGFKWAGGEIKILDWFFYVNGMRRKIFGLTNPKIHYRSDWFFWRKEENLAVQRKNVLFGALLYYHSYFVKPINYSFWKFCGYCFTPRDTNVLILKKNMDLGCK